eukprot:NODE_5692_length_624_cov_18.505030_g5528_i0.p2 GENE.NODE_5692_length_624_cov_18.505030_g5528_i0~~NODE_5692_length_624_cov_18.505030_g5528_i0.p2  ORF type:complete len:200 (-),score=54.52 NODE_5692_length_624_cov_18.505030_g5528_i0:23-592(-)
MTEAPASMEELFENTRGLIAYMSAPTMSPAQHHCSTLADSNLKFLPEQKNREKYLKEVIVCITGVPIGYHPDDGEEPMNGGVFSHLPYYHNYLGLIYHTEQFDYLLHCIARKVCIVCEEYCGTFVALIDKLKRPVEVSVIPEWVVNHLAQEEEDEERRKDTFVLKTDWVKPKPNRLDIALPADPLRQFI